MFDQREEPQHIFIFGLDRFHQEQLSQMRDRDRYSLRSLLNVDDLFNRPSYSLEDLVTRACAELEAFPYPIAGVTGYWDFPTTDLIPLVAAEFGLPGPTLESVIKCEHKYLSRMEQRLVVPEMVPDCELVDPFDPQAAERIRLAYPFWLKPVRSHSSYLGFEVHDADELEDALAQIRDKNIAGDEFGKLMARADLPDDIQQAGGTACIAEEMIEGHQCTVEGYAREGKVFTIGIIDSVNDENGSSFVRYQYPSSLPDGVQERMLAATRKVLTQIGLNDSAFNIEFFYDRETDQLWVLEINPRISQSHSEIFALVDGAPNSQVSVKLAAGESPDMPVREGPYPVAAKFMVRCFEDGIVTRVPSPEDLAEVEQRFPGARVTVDVEAGMRLSDLTWQDSYSYEIAQVYLGASTAEELDQHYQQVLDILDFRVEACFPVPSGDRTP